MFKKHTHWTYRSGEINKKIYMSDKEDYRRFLSAVNRQLDQDDEMYIDFIKFIIEILKQEVKYAALRELYRGNADGKFNFPFERMDPNLLDYQQTDTEYLINIADVTLISAPYREDKYIRALRNRKNKPFINYDDHKVIYYENLNIAYADGGRHSLAVASYLGSGKVKMRKFDTIKIFDYVAVDPHDLSVTYQEKNIKANLENKKYKLTIDDEKEMKKRFVGTDYRLLLIFTLCQKLYDLKTNKIMMKEIENGLRGTKNDIK